MSTSTRPLAVGQTWQGDSMSAFPTVVAQPSPPKIPPAFTSVNGTEYLKLVLPAGAERVQPQSAGLLTLNGCYQMTLTTLIDQGWITVPAGDWFAVFQLWGAPFKGSPNVQLQIDSGGNIGPREASGVWLAKVPITYGVEMDWEIDLEWATQGQLTVRCNGTTIYNNPNYNPVTSADITGPSSFEPHVYTKASGLPTQSECLYRNMSVACVQSLSPTPTPPPPPPPSPSPTPQADLTAAIAGLASLATEHTEIGASLSNIEKATTLKGAHASAATGLQRLAAAASTTNTILANVQAASAGVAPTPTPTPTPAPTGPQPNAPLPAGNWNLIFDDEFNGTQVDTSTWDEHNGWTGQNGVTDSAANVSETGGNLILKLVSNKSGAAVEADKFDFLPGMYIEASISFEGVSAGTIDDWPAWWVSGPNWPAAGENDIAEGLGGQLTVNYHSPTGAHNMGAIPGSWANGFHAYGLYKTPDGNTCDVWWDGKLVKSYATSDNHQGQQPILTFGYGGGTFAPAQMLVDYVRAWAQG